MGGTVRRGEVRLPAIHTYLYCIYLLHINKPLGGDRWWIVDQTRIRGGG